jgi:hypothetical protein
MESAASSAVAGAFAKNCESVNHSNEGKPDRHLQRQRLQRCAGLRRLSFPEGHLAFDSFQNLRSIWFSAKVHLTLSRLDQEMSPPSFRLDPGDRRRLREGVENRAPTDSSGGEQAQRRTAPHGLTRRVLLMGAPNCFHELVRSGRGWRVRLLRDGPPGLERREAQLACYRPLRWNHHRRPLSDPRLETTPCSFRRSGVCDSSVSMTGPPYSLPGSKAGLADSRSPWKNESRLHYVT